MSDENGNGFVERPSLLPRSGGRQFAAPGTLTGRLVATASNGKAILVKRWQSQGPTRDSLLKHGFHVRTTKNGAPSGHVYAWTEKIGAKSPDA